MFYGRRLLAVVLFAALPGLLAGCGDVDVPGGDKPYPNLSDFPEMPDAAELDKRRRRLVGKYGDPASALPKSRRNPARAPEGALRVAVIQFQRAEQEIDDAGMDILAQVAAYAQQSRASVWLFGYASQRIELASGGTAAAASRKLAEGRVESVAVVLIKEGVPADKLHLITRGALDPMFEESADTGVAGNRRVEIYLTRGTEEPVVKSPDS